jgi:hypothetical protein
MAQTYQLFMPIDREDGQIKMRPGPNRFGQNRVSFLSVRVVVMVMTMMVTAGGECRGGKHHQKQGCSEKLFHAKNVARPPPHEKCIPAHAPKEARGENPFQFRNRNQFQFETALTCREPR